MLVEGSSHGAMNGTTEVTVVPAPRDSVRRVVRLVNVFNDDTAAVTLKLYLKDGATLRQITELPAIPAKERKEYPENGGVYVLDTTSKSLVAKLAGGVVANQPVFTAHYGDSS